MLDAFTVLTGDLDHPEDCVWDPASGRSYAGGVYIACYRPDLIYKLSPAADPAVLAADPLDLKLNTPTNVAFCGPDLDRLLVANVGETHLLIGAVGAQGRRSSTRIRRRGVAALGCTAEDRDRDKGVVHGSL